MSFLRLNEFLGQDEKKPRILVVTACGRKKHDRPMAAWKLYKSPRIRAVYNRTMGHDMGILSAKYGLIRADEVIEPYQALMDEEKAKDFVNQVAEAIEEYDYVIYFRGGARKEYLDCIRNACKNARKKLIVVGYANMGAINRIPEIIASAEKGEIGKILRMNHAHVHHY